MNSSSMEVIRSLSVLAMAVAFDSWRWAYVTHVWLPDAAGFFRVGGIPTPLKNMTSSNGIIVPNMMGKSYISHVPSHQPDSYTIVISIISYIYSYIYIQIVFGDG